MHGFPSYGVCVHIQVYVGNKVGPYVTIPEYTGLQDYIRIYRSIKDYTGLYRTIVSYTGPCWTIQDCTELYRTILDYTGL